VEPISWLDVSRVFSSQTTIAMMFEWEKPSFFVFSNKSEVSVVSVLTGTGEVKMNVAYFGRKYDYCRLHRTDYDVIT